MLRFSCSLALVSLALAACTTSSGGITGATGSAVAGPEDSHCGTTVVVDPAACMLAADAAAPDAAADDGGPSGGYGATLFNAEGDDDDCKYHVKWTATAIQRGIDVTFNLTLTAKKDGSPVRAAPLRAEVFLNDTHPAPNTDQKSPETSAGVYGVGPIRFDAAGRWTVRFHFHEECDDATTSPHGHAAFFVDVP
jgi:hypothetical protein